MASRRLAISSLLCEDDSKIGQVQGSFANSPQDAPHPPSPYGHVPSSAQPSTSSTSPTMTYGHDPPSHAERRSYEIAHLTQQYQQEYEESQSPPYNAVSRTESPDPLALLPAGYRQRTPTPPSSSPGSPPLRSTYEKITYSDEESLTRHSRNLSENSHWSHSEQYQETPTPPSAESSQLHSRRPSYPLPVGYAPIQEDEFYSHAQRRSPVLPYAYGATSPAMHTTMSLDTTFSNSLPVSLARASMSPTTTFQAPRTLFIQTGERATHGAPLGNVDPSHQQQSPRYPTGAANASPLLSAGPFSGLDALVQAATVESERIDEHRRLSGGSTGLPISHSRSPVMSREEVLVDPRMSPPQGFQHRTSSQSHWSPGMDRENIHTHSPVFEKSSRSHSPEHLRWSNNDVQRHSPEQTFVELPYTATMRSPVVDTTAPYLDRPSYATTIPLDQHFPQPMDAPSRISGIASPSTASQSIPQDAHQLQRNVNRLSSDIPRRELITVEIPPAPSPELPTPRSRANYSRYPQKMVPVSNTEGTSPPSDMDFSLRGPQTNHRSATRPRKPGSAALAAAKRAEKRDAEAAFTLRSISQDISRRTAHASMGHGHPSTSSPSEQFLTSSASRQSATRGFTTTHYEGVPKRKEGTGDVDDFFLSTAASRGHTGHTQGPLDVHLNRNAPTVSSDSLARQFVQHRGSVVSPSYAHLNVPRHADFDSEVAVNFEPASGDEWDENARGEEDTDLDGALADAIGHPSSEDEGGKDVIRDDGMDVDDELLSLLDGPDHHVHARRQSSQLGSSTELHDYSRDAVAPDNFVSPTVPPPFSGRPAPPERRKESRNSKGKAKAIPVDRNVEAVKQKRSTSSLKGQDGEVKNLPEKSKTKANAPKAGSSKLNKSGQAAVNPSPMQLAPTFDSTAVDNVMPSVTSSGRIVTKSKKSAAAASNVQSRRKGIHQSRDQRESQSRSHSVVPSPSVEPETRGKLDERKGDANEGADAEDDNKLYCICRTTYNENRVMIACDRCDEWYHTQCVKMSDLEVDLVDQFFCPVCIASNPNLPLQTTYKPRCMAGLKHPRPNTVAACHKPSRGALSKYCSDECGVKYMRSKVEGWAKQGGDLEQLWESVKGAKKREGVVRHEPGKLLLQKLVSGVNGLNNVHAIETSGADDAHDFSPKVLQTLEQQAIIKRLRKQLETIANERELRKKELDFIQQREQLLQLAIDRAKEVGECGWDQRLCFGEEEWVDFGDGVLESYLPDSKAKATHVATTEDQDMQVDGPVDDAVWWCHGEPKCDRHAGWQKLRSSELKFEKESKETQLTNLTSKEREIRKRIEDFLSPQNATHDLLLHAPKLTVNRSLTNGVSGMKPGEGGGKKSKKKHS